MPYENKTTRQGTRSTLALNNIRTINVNSGKYSVHSSCSKRLNVIKIPVKIGSVVVNALVDTGAEISAVSDQVLALFKDRDISYVGESNVNVYSAADDPMVSQGVFRIVFVVLGGLSRQMEHDFHVICKLRGGMILGMDFVSKYGVVIDCLAKSLLFLDNGPRGRATIAKIEIGPIIDEKPAPQFQLSHLPRNVKNTFKALFDEFSEIFAKSMLELGCTSLCKHKITIEGPPVCAFPYKVPIS